MGRGWGRVPQYFCSRVAARPGAAAVPDPTVDAVLAPAHRALASAPDARRLDDALAWMARGLVEHLDLDRAMVLRRDPARLAMSAIAFSEQPELAHEARHNAERHPVDLRSGGLEVEMMRRGTAALVLPADDPRAWHPITDQLGTLAYVAAPVVAFGRTVATLHADALFSGREVDARDRGAIGAFAVVCGGVAERALLFEEVERLRGGVRAHAEQLLALAGDEPAPSPPAASPSLSHPDLTPRENEVLALMSRGATSQEIARVLVLSAGTVKTHAHNILRKLGAGTRAEAVARAAEYRAPQSTRAW